MAIGCTQPLPDRVIQIEHDDYSSDMANWLAQNSSALDDSIFIRLCALSACNGNLDNSNHVEFTIEQGDVGNKISAKWSDPKEEYFYLPEKPIDVVPVTSDKYYQTLTYIMSLSAVLHLDTDNDLVHMRKDLADLYVKVLVCLEYGDWAYGFLTQMVFESVICEKGVTMMAGAMHLYKESGKCTNTQCFENVSKIVVTLSDYMTRWEVENELAASLAEFHSLFIGKVSPIFSTLLLQRAMERGSIKYDQVQLCNSINAVPGTNDYQRGQLEKAKTVHKCG